MKSKVLFENDYHKWIVFGRDVGRGGDVVDTNEFLIVSNEVGMLLDPGGIDIFPRVLAEITRFVPVEKIEVLFASHQDPDIISSLSMWLDLCTNAKTYSPWLWCSFITHFLMGNRCEIEAIPDKGMEIPIGTQSSVQAVPAHFCHSSGNFSIYDPVADILFSGDIGSALLPNNDFPFIVENFNDHIQYMKALHQRWMPSSTALRGWARRVRSLNPSMICPQHGSLFAGEDVEAFLSWIESLEVGHWDE